MVHELEGAGNFTVCDTCHAKKVPSYPTSDSKMCVGCRQNEMVIRDLKLRITLRRPLIDSDRALSWALNLLLFVLVSWCAVCGVYGLLWCIQHFVEGNW